MKDLDAKLETVNALHRETLEAMTDRTDLEAELQVSLHVNDQLRARITELETALDAFHKDPENPDARVLRYKAIASKAIREQVEIREKYEAALAECHRNHLKLELRCMDLEAEKQAFKDGNKYHD